MRNSEWSERESLPEDDVVEIVDLELPEKIGDNSPFWSAIRFLAWQRTWNRGRFRLWTILSMVLLIAPVLLFSMHVSLPDFESSNGNGAHSLANMSFLAKNTLAAPVQINASVGLLPQENGIACLSDSAWSTDSAYVAFLGYEKDCVYGSHVYERGLLAVYSGLTGKLVRLLSPDSAIFSALRTRFPAIHTALNIYYVSVLWSPDKHSIALMFDMGLPTLIPLANGNIVGVAMVDNSSGHVQVMLGTHPRNGLPVEWDVQKQQELPPVAVPSLIPPVETGTAIPVISAYSYRWGADGTLVPEVIRGHYFPLPRSRQGKLLIGHVGNPDGDRYFTIWQPGIGMLNTRDSKGNTYAPGVFTWNTSFAAWSPDERYLISSLDLQGRLQVPGQTAPSSSTLAKLHLDHLPALPVRDSALHHLLLTLSSSTFNIVVAWQPAGLLLAAYDYGMVDLDIYDCGTGDEVASLALPDLLRTDLSGTTMLRWSPDGTRLLLFDAQSGIVTIWNVSKIP
jgi:WD40 repeat protein